MSDWQPATIDYVKHVVAHDLLECDAEQLELFKRCEVEPYAAPITRYGRKGTVVVIARNADEVIYYEDIEAGFNVSPVGPEGAILEHWCNQDELRFALNYWIEGRVPPGKFGPAQPIK